MEIHRLIPNPPRDMHKMQLHAAQIHSGRPRSSKVPSSRLNCTSKISQAPTFHVIFQFDRKLLLTHDIFQTLHHYNLPLSIEDGCQLSKLPHNDSWTEIKFSLLRIRGGKFKDGEKIY